MNMDIKIFGSTEVGLDGAGGFDRLLKGLFWLGQEHKYWQPRTASDTKIDFREPAGGYVARTVIEGSDLVVGEPTRLIGGTVTSIKFYEGKRLIAHFSDFSWDAAELGDAATRASPGGGGDRSDLQKMILAEPLTYDLSGSYHGMDTRLLNAQYPITFVGSGATDFFHGGDAADTMYGGPGLDKLYGHDGDDTLYGGAGNDYFYGGAGADVFVGGPAADYDLAVYFGNYAALAVIDLRDPSRNTGPAAGDTYFGIEGVIGTSGPTEIHGNGRDNFLSGVSGDDRLYGRGGNDYLWANNANFVTLVGGDGDDILRVGHIKHAVLDGGAGNDTANFNTLEALWQGQHADLTRTQINDHDSVDTAILISIENITGTQYADDLRGDDGANRLDGERGPDLLIGRGGADVLDGGDGKDRLRGGDGNDVLSGGKRPDRLEGGAGRDLLSGGEGPDVFIFAGSGTDGHRDRDVITDFEAGTDRLLLAERTIASVRRTDDGVRLLLDGTDGDAIDLIGLTKTQIDLLGSALFV